MNNIHFAAFLHNYLQENVPDVVRDMVNRGVKKTIYPEEKGKVVTSKVRDSSKPRIIANISKALDRPITPIKKVYTK